MAIICYLMGIIYNAKTAITENVQLDMQDIYATIAQPIIFGLNQVVNYVQVVKI